MNQVETPSKEGRWQKIRGALMLIVACIFSPCFAPLLVPIVLSLLAGTSVALWMGQNLGWVYGGLTLICFISFAVGWRWMRQSQQASATRPIDIPVNIPIGE